MNPSTDSEGSAGFQPASGSPSRLKAGAPSTAPSNHSGVAPKTTLLGWYSRGYLPHFDQPGRIQAVTFRLADSLPGAVLARLEAEIETLPVERHADERRQRIAAALDRGHGACWLARPELAAVVHRAIQYFDGERYRLLGWCVMPNHVHVIIEPLGSHSLAAIVHTWKRHTARVCNQLLGTEGAFWMREYFDRYIRDAVHLAATLDYVERNPVAAGLAAAPDLWPWSSAPQRPNRVAQNGSAGPPVFNRHQDNPAG